MSITIIPRPPTGPTSGTAAGKLATTLLSVAVAGMAEPSRFRRGRAYVAGRAVTRLDVSPGLLRATVVGSRHDPYVVEIRTPMTTRPAGEAEPQREHMIRLVPDGDDLRVACSCPDEETPCKHVVATILCFASELGERPELLVEWRCGSNAAAPTRAVVGSRARGERHLRLVAPPPPPSPFETDEWARFERAVSSPPASWAELFEGRPPIVIATHILDRVDLGEVVRSAVDAVRGGGGPLPPTGAP